MGKFVVCTDHRPLVYLFSLIDPSSRLTKFRLALEEYSFEVQYKRGSENVVADALSRISVEELKKLTPQTSLVCTREEVKRKKLKLGAPNKVDDVASPLNYIKIETGFMKTNETLEAQLKQGTLCVDPNTTLTHLRGVMKRVVDFAKGTGIKGLIVNNTRENKN